MKSICILLALLWMTGPFSQAQVKKEFKIEGNIKGLKTGSKLCMVIKRVGKVDTIATASAQNGLFTFKNVKLPVYPEFYLVSIQTEFVENLQLFLDQAGDVEIIGELKNWPGVSIIGSKSHSDYCTYLKYEQHAHHGIDSLGYLSASASKKHDYGKKARLSFIQKYSNSHVLPYALLVWKDWDGQDLHPSYKRPYYDQLSASGKNSYYGRELKKNLEISEKANFINPGDMFPEVSVLNENNETETILNLVKKNKLTLIDCWYTGCAPCRKEFPEIEKILAKYKYKGFSVIGVSSDKDPTIWKKSVKQDNTSWSNFIQDKDLSLSKAFELYGPGAYFLVNNQGKIIAFDGPSKNIRPFGGGLKREQLDMKLEELLGK